MRSGDLTPVHSSCSQHECAVLCFPQGSRPRDSIWPPTWTLHYLTRFTLDYVRRAALRCGNLVLLRWWRCWWWRRSLFCRLRTGPDSVLPVLPFARWWCSLIPRPWLVAHCRSPDFSFVSIGSVVLLFPVLLSVNSTISTWSTLISIAARSISSAVSPSIHDARSILISPFSPLVGQWVTLPNILRFLFPSPAFTCSVTHLSPCFAKVDSQPELYASFLVTLRNLNTLWTMSWFMINEITNPNTIPIAVVFIEEYGAPHKLLVSCQIPWQARVRMVACIICVKIVPRSSSVSL